MSLLIRVQIPGHTAAEWIGGNPVLLDRELAAERDTGKFKLGDGAKAWADLPYQLFWSRWGRIDGDITSQPDLIAALTARTLNSANLSDLANAATARSNLGAAASGANTDITSITGSSARWTTARSITATGDVSWSVSVNGAGDVSSAATLATVPITKGGTGATTAAGARTALGAAPTASPAITGTAMFEEASFGSSRTTGLTAQLLFQYSKSSGQGPAVSFRRPTSATQSLFGFETGSASGPDGYFGTVPNVTGRLNFLGGSGNGASMAIDSAQGLIVGSGLLSTFNASISASGAGIFSSVRPGSYTVATVPAPSLGPGTTIYVSNESGGAVLAFSDGSNWRRVTDRVVIS